MSKHKRRPSRRTLQNLISWLEEQGLSVYGPNLQGEMFAISGGT